MTKTTARPRRRRLAALAVLVLGGCAALAACSGGGDEPTVSSSTHTSSSPSTPSATATSGTAEVTPIGAKWDWGRFDSYRTYLKSMSGGPTYYELTWCGVEPSQGIRNWQTVDRVVKRVDEIGMTPMLKIRTGMCWATQGSAQYQRGKADKTESGVPKSMDQYKDFVKAVVTRYSAMGVHEFALENEVNSPSYWAGTPEQLQQLMEAGSSAIKTADASAKVVDFGLASTTYGYGIADDLLKAGKTQDAISAYNAYFERRIGTRGDKIPRVTTAAQLQSVLDSDQGQRNLAYLAMATTLAEKHVVDVRQIHFYEKWSSVPMLMDYLKRHTPTGVPIEAWEVGSFWKDGDGSEAERSQEVTKTVVDLLAAGAAKVIWLPLTVDPTGRNSDEPRYGLLDPDGTVRPAGSALSSVAGAARGATAVPVASAGLAGVGFEQGGSSTLFVWGTKNVDLPMAAKMATPGSELKAVSKGDSSPTADGVQQIQVQGTVAGFVKGVS